MSIEPLTCPCCDGKKLIYNPQDRDPFGRDTSLSRNFPCAFCNGRGEIRSDDARYVAVSSYWRAMRAVTAVRAAAERAKGAG